MMEGMLGTPSRFLRRIQDLDGQDVPSLPSFPPFEDDDPDPLLEDSESSNDILSNVLLNAPSPMTSTPTTTVGHHTLAPTTRPPPSVARFAASVASRSSRSSLGPSASNPTFKRGPQESFDVSVIPSLPNVSMEQSSNTDASGGERSRHSEPDVYVPGEHDPDELSLTEALQSVSRSGSPYPTDPLKDDRTTPKKYDYSASLKSEPKLSPFDKYRNVAVRKTFSARTRTPSLSRTGSSSESSPSNSTPHSVRSFANSPSNPQSPGHGYSASLPRSNSDSPVNVLSPRSSDNSHEERDHEITVQSMGAMGAQLTYLNTDHGLRQEDEITTADEGGVGESEAEPEPTFSSDGEPTPYAANYRDSPRPQLNMQAQRFSSPAQSDAFTPMPAHPRRARFALPTTGGEIHTPRPQVGPEEHTSDQEEQEGQEESSSLEDPLTPHARRKSFLLSVINSTARPRLKLPTPYPRHSVPTAPGILEETPGPRVTLHAAFAGVTPRIRHGASKHSRLSHALAQATIHGSPQTSDTESTSLASGTVADSAPPLMKGTRRMPGRASLGSYQTSGLHSRYDGVDDHTSFVSTASSHDLTTHHRVNTSFDPSMGFGTGGGQGVGRFNAGKLNNYLHGLNKRLQEENEALLDRLQVLEEERKGLGGEPISAESSEAVGNERRLSAGEKRVSLGGAALGKVAEDTGGEWIEEKAELEALVEVLREEVAQATLKTDDAVKALEQGKEERSRDKERWKERMTEVEKGVTSVVQELESKAEAAEKRVKDLEVESAENLEDLKRCLAHAEAARDDALQRAENAERALESGQELGGELRDANERLAKVTDDLRNADTRTKELEAEVMRASCRIDELEKDSEEDKEVITTLKAEVDARTEQIEAGNNQVQQLEHDVEQADERLEALTNYVSELEEGAVEAIDRINTLEDELAAATEKVQEFVSKDKESFKKLEQLKEDAQNAQELVRQMEDALEEVEKKTLADADEINDLRTRVASMERGRQREASMLEESSRNPFAAVGPSEADVEALENELEVANKEIARLTGLLNQSPARKAMEKAREAKMEMLEREKEELLERNKALRMAMNEINTPSRVINTSGISPIHRHVLSLSIRAPKTPGAPLKDLSWLNSVSSDPTVSPLVAEIRRLQRELDFANESIDDKLDKLEDVGQGVVGLTKKLEDARSRVSELEDEIARHNRREDRRQRMLERTRCQKCHTKVNLSKLSQLDQSSLEISQDDLATEPPTSPTRTTEALRANLKTVNTHLESLKKEWDAERRQLLGEKAVLQDATQRLNLQVQQAKEELRKVNDLGRAGDKAVASTQGELDKAKLIITDLESDLKSERAQLRSLMSKQGSVEREKNEVLRQLQRTESDMEDVKLQLQKCKKENHDLERELRENANIEQKARLLESRVTENAETIDNLRHERSLLVANHKELQQRFSEITEAANQLRQQHDTSSTAHENRRHQLDLYVSEIADLRRALSEQAGELRRTEIENDRISAEQHDVGRTVAVLEADLKRVKKDAEVFGRDLKLLRAEKEKQEVKHKEELVKLERVKKQTQAQIRLLNEQLDDQRGRIDEAQKSLRTHVCAPDESALAAVKVQHNNECKGLIVQIRYLKAKFTRESALRYNLVYQKEYLLVLLSRFEKSEQTIFASIAKIGFPISLPPPTRRPPKLKSVILVIVFLSRARRSSEFWRDQSSSKQAVLAALQDVRRRRAEAAS